MIYNDLGQLRFVLSPEYQNDQHKAIFAYEYRYDERGNIVKKFLPQCEYIQYWYDSADRLIYMQDGRMRSKGLYRFYLYDNLSRVVMEGTCTSCNRGGTVTRATLNASSAGLLNTGYIMDHNLNLGSPKIEVVNYYDDYSFLNLQVFKNNTALKKAVNPSNQVSAKGFTTGSISASNRGSLLLSTLYYDLKGEVTEIHRTLPNDALLVTKKTYSFTGNPETTKQTLYKGGKTYEVSTSNSYNQHNDKLSTTSLSVDGGTGHEVSSITYDDLGRISNTSHGSNNMGATSYSYNLRGWTTDIVNSKFEEHLTYNEGQGTPYYNGNISTQQWRTVDDNILRGYKFTYDKLNRLINAIYGEGSSYNTNQGRYSEIITGYTANGAIKGIIRNGLTQKGIYAAIDSLDITLNGNQLKKVDDKAAPVLRAGSFDFRKVSPPLEGQGEVEYLYDENGSLIQDANRGITKIEYDNRNNPTLIQFSDGSQTEYVYTAVGEKLRTIHRTASPNMSVPLGEKIQLDKPVSVDSTDYIENFIFENGKIDKYLFNGGYYTYATPQTGYTRYHYYVADHLGNYRVVMNGNDSVEQVTHYYPFGVVYADAGFKPDFQKYKYTGKELDLTHGLNTYDHGARQNYSILGVWDRIDPLAERYYYLSPYVVCEDNPVIATDPNGKGPIVGAAIGFGIEYASQVIGNYDGHKSLYENFVEDIDWADVGIATVEGAVTSGTSSIVKKTVVSTITSAIKEANNKGTSISQVGKEALSGAIQTSVGARTARVFTKIKFKGVKAKPSSKATLHKRAGQKRYSKSTMRNARKRLQKKKDSFSEKIENGFSAIWSIGKSIYNKLIH